MSDEPVNPEEFGDSEVQDAVDADDQEETETETQEVTTQEDNKEEE